MMSKRSRDGIVFRIHSTDTFLESIWDQRGRQMKLVRMGTRTTPSSS